jgi:hypothetical protein
VHNFGGAVHVLSFLALIIVPFVAMAHGRQVQYRPLDIAMPAATLFTLNIFTKLARVAAVVVVFNMIGLGSFQLGRRHK